MIVGLSTPEWTEIGGGYWWEHNTDVPLIITCSRFFVLIAVFGVFTAEVLYLGSYCSEQIPMKYATKAELWTIYGSAFSMLLGIVLFVFWAEDRQLGAYGYSFWITVGGAFGLIAANMFALSDMKADKRKEGYIPA